MNKFKKTDYLYTPLFCEENIWHFIKMLIDKGIKEQVIKVVFLTNKNKQIAIFNQQAADQDQAVIWDYHVILMVNIDQSHYVFDFDTRLPFPDSIENYLKNSLPDNINTEYMSHFRIIPANVYLRNFHSDRSHMKNTIPEHDFPNYPAILSNKKNKMHLTDLLDAEKNIDNTLIFRGSRQLINWVEAQ